MSGVKRRSRLFIAKRFQSRYIGLIVGMMFFVVILTGYLVYVTTWIMFGEKLAAVYPQGLLMDIVKRVNLVLFLRLLILTPFVVLIGLVLSNRVAGPIFNIKRYLAKILTGDYSSDIQLRKKDELQDLAAEINLLVRKLRKDRTNKNTICSEMEIILQEIENFSKEKEESMIKNKLKELEEKIRQISAI